LNTTPPRTSSGMAATWMAWLTAWTILVAWASRYGVAGQSQFPLQHFFSTRPRFNMTCLGYIHCRKPVHQFPLGRRLILSLGPDVARLSLRHH
jgi:hypothetical protein